MEQFEPKDYHTFEFPGFTVDGGQVRFRYLLDGVDQVEFVETWEFPAAINDAAARLLRLLYLAAGPSYYKTAAPATVRLHGTGSSAEIDYLSQVISHGLAEFAYTNDLYGALFPQITADEVAEPAGAITAGGDPHHALTPVGGGKDSCVSIDAVARAGMTQTLFCVNEYQPITDVAQAANLPLLMVRRTLSPSVFAANALGAYNGHVPVTAANSLAALVTAAIIGAGHVFMSNERSASEENLWWHGHRINHQWSKSLEAEGLLRENVAAHVSDIEYVSLLRPYSEYRIAERFAQLPAFHGVFTSCGRAFTVNPAGIRLSWCGRCAKCRFVSLILAPFLGPDRLWAIFGQDLFVGDNTEFLKLAGIGGHKPLDCVGEVLETRYAIREASEELWADNTFVQDLRAAIPDEQMPTPGQVEVLLTPSDAHFLPAGLAHVLD